MSKTLISVLVLGVVLVGGYFIVKNGKGIDTTTPAMENTQNAEGQMEATGEKKMAFSEFIKQGGSYKCDVKQAMSDFDNTGTVYVDGAKVRGDFTTVAEGMTVTTSIVSESDYTYVWMNGVNGLPASGFKTKNKVDATTGTGGFTWNPETVGDYNCEVWQVDEAVFALPTDITFQETAI